MVSNVHTIGEPIGWARLINNHEDEGKQVLVCRYVSGSYQPARRSGADKDGDYWTSDKQCIGKADSAFEWCDDPEPTQHVTSQVVLQMLIESGKITDADIQSARTAAKLLNKVRP